MKKWLNNEKDCRLCVCHRCCCMLGPAVKPPMQRLSRRLRLCTSWFSCQKDPYRFYGRTKKQTPPAPHSGTFNGSKGIKTIHQPSYLPNTATVDIFLFQKGKAKAGRPLAVLGRPELAEKMSPQLPFSGRWTTSNSTSKSALTRPLKVLRWPRF